MSIRNIFPIIVLSLCISCNDFLDIRPTGKIIAETGAEYRALLTYVYKNIPEDRGLSSLRSDEFDLINSINEYDYTSYFDIWAWNDLSRQDGTSSWGWRGYYHTIYIANYIIEHQHEITRSTRSEIDQMVGEAYMLRAYMHFLLVNLYADAYTTCDPATTRGIPLQLQADVEQVLRCSSVEAVYKSILDDIESARKHLNVERWDEGYTYRFNTISADALKARVALYMGRWQEAFDAAETVLTAYPDLEDMNQSSSTLPTHYKSVESIVALEQVMTANVQALESVSASLLAAYRSGDLRKSKYFKAKTLSVWILRKGGTNEQRCSFRSGEFYLIAAETANELDRPDIAADYLKRLMQKRYTEKKHTEYASAIDTMTKEELRTEILNERRCELAFEGHRWYDLRRAGQPELTKTYKNKAGETTTYTLDEGDSRYTIMFPTEAVEANPEIEIWN